MATHTAKIVTQAQLAKSPLFDELETVYKHLSTIPPDEALRCVSDYFAAVANIVDIDARDVFDIGEDPDTIAREKRRILMDYLRDTKTLGDKSGAFLRDVSQLMIHVQKVWAALAQERPLNRLFDLARSYPELILPESFGMRHYFKANSVAPETVTVLRYASRIPDLMKGVYTLPGVGEPRTIQ